MTFDLEYRSDGPQCPYCGHVHRPDEPFYYDEASTEMHCDRCEKRFTLECIDTGWRWTTAPELEREEQ